MNIKLSKELFNEAYLPYLFDYSQRYNVYYGGRSSGKSYFIVDKLMIKALNDKRRMLFLMKQGNKVEDTVWRMALDTLHKFKLYDKCKINKSVYTIELPNGSWIKCMGCDDAEKLKGQVNISDIWFEECTAFNVDDVELGDGTMRGKSKNKQIYFSFNPISKANWVYTYFGFDTGIIPPDTFILKTTYKHNKWCDDGTIKRLERLKERDYTRYKIEADGDFATLDKLVYSHKVQEFDYRQLLRMDGTTAIYGCDWGYVNDPTALVCAVVDETDKKLYIYDEFFKKGLTNPEIADVIKSKNLQKEIIVADCAERKSIEEIRRLGIDRIRPCRKGKDSIMHGIQKLQQYEIIVHPSCEKMIEELNNYCWQKDRATGEYINKPIDTFNHGLDALRYAIQTVTGKGKVKILNKNLFGL